MDSKKPTHQRYAVQAHNVNKAYVDRHRRVEVLKNLNLELKPGEHVAVIGRSGSGKSTLLSLLAGLDQVDSGDLVFNEKKLAGLSNDDLTLWRQQTVSIVFQQFHLIQFLTAVENVSLPLEIGGWSYQEAHAKANNLLIQVGLENRAHHYPSQLSGGESQRVALARALVTDPLLLLADEPSGNLDMETGRVVMDLMFALCRQNKTTLLLVTHSTELANVCERVLRLEGGRLVENVSNDKVTV